MFLYKLLDFTCKSSNKTPGEHFEVYCGDTQVSKIIKKVISDDEAEFTIIWTVDVKAIKQTKSSLEEALNTIREIITNEVAERMNYCKYFIKSF